MLDRLDLTALAAEMTVGFGLRSHALTGPETVMLSLADPGPDSCIILVAPNTVALAHAMLREDCRNFTVVQLPAAHPRPAHAYLVLVPEAGYPAAITWAASYARRALKPLGTVILRLPADQPIGAARHAIRQLSLNGFSTVRSRAVFGDTVLCAGLPEHRTLSCV